MHAPTLTRAVLTVASVAAVASMGVAAPGRAVSVRHFANCTQLNREYPHGVGLTGAHDKTSGTPVTNFARRPAVYRANSGSDRDGDHVACERP